MSDGSSPESGWWQASDGKWYPPDKHPSRRQPSPPPAAPAAQQPSFAEPATPVPPPAPAVRQAPPGWWQASDGKWYPPENHPSAASPVVPPPVAPPQQPVAPQPDPQTFARPDTPPATPSAPPVPPATPIPPATPAFAAPSGPPGPPTASTPSPQGDGWWQASDGKWYPPSSAPTQTVSAAPQKPPTGKGVTVAAGIIGLLVILAGIGYVATRGEPEDAVVVDAPGGQVDGGDPVATTPAPELESESNEGVVGGESGNDINESPSTTAAPQAFDENFPGPSEPVEIIGSDGEPWNVASSEALGNIEDYWGRIMPEVFGIEYEPIQGGFYAYSSNEPIPPCARSGSDVENNAFYCGFEDVVAWDDELLFREVHEFAGDLGVGLILAHEIGHAIQERVGMDGRTVTLENQADCYAGAWIASVAENPNDRYEVQSADLDRALIQMVEIADQPGTGATDPFAHGNAFDRINGFRDGLEQGAEKCATYNDQNVVITQIRFTEADFASGGNLPFITASPDDDDLFDLMPSDIEDFWANTFPAEFDQTWDPLAGGVQAFEEGRNEPTCGGEAVSNKAYFCRTDDYIGMETTTTMRSLYEQFGDLSPGVVLAAQYGYAVQARLDTPRDQLLNSLQADCYAGAWVQSLLPASQVPGELGLVISAGDLNESVETLLLLGDEFETDDQRGTGFERVGAFRAGVLQGVPGCSQYTP